MSKKENNTQPATPAFVIPSAPKVNAPKLSVEQIARLNAPTRGTLEIVELPAGDLGIVKSVTKVGKVLIPSDTEVTKIHLKSEVFRSAVMSSYGDVKPARELVLLGNDAEGNEIELISFKVYAGADRLRPRGSRRPGVCLNLEPSTGFPTKERVAVSADGSSRTYNNPDWDSNPGLGIKLEGIVMNAKDLGVEGFAFWWDGIPVREEGSANTPSASTNPLEAAKAAVAATATEDPLA